MLSRKVRLLITFIAESAVIDFENLTFTDFSYFYVTENIFLLFIFSVFPISLSHGFIKILRISKAFLQYELTLSIQLARFRSQGVKSVILCRYYFINVKFLQLHRVFFNVKFDILQLFYYLFILCLTLSWVWCFCVQACCYFFFLEHLFNLTINFVTNKKKFQIQSHPLYFGFVIDDEVNFWLFYSFFDKIIDVLLIHLWLIFILSLTANDTLVWDGKCLWKFTKLFFQ